MFLWCRSLMWEILHIIRLATRSFSNVLESVLDGTSVPSLPGACPLNSTGQMR